MPATVQAAIEARIDRLERPAKRTLTAASVVGLRFDAELLTALRLEPVFDELLSAELIDQVRFTPQRGVRLPPPVDPRGGLRIAAEIRSRRMAPAPGRRDRRAASPRSVEDNAALIAEHLQAAGELHAAYGWHMRAAAWSTNRDIGRRPDELGAGPLG